MTGVLVATLLFLAHTPVVAADGENYDMFGVIAAMFLLCSCAMSCLWFLWADRKGNICWGTIHVAGPRQQEIVNTTKFVGVPLPQYTQGTVVQPQQEVQPQHSESVIMQQEPSVVYGGQGQVVDNPKYGVEQSRV
eukprot:m.18111 g.18111  ORF g.18111 m.18111 type:complete len:135 (+) comp5626_c0_seq2:370-774(+)